MNLKRKIRDIITRKTPLIFFCDTGYYIINKILFICDERVDSILIMHYTCIDVDNFPYYKLLDMQLQHQE